MSGAELIAIHAAYREQSESALDSLLTGVRKYAMAITGDEDLAQEAATLIWRKLHQFNPERGTFASWVRTIVSNCRRMRARNKADRNTISVTEDFLSDLDHRLADQTVRTPELLRELLLHGPPQARELLSTALASRTGDLYQAGKLLGLTTNQVAHKRRLLKKYVQEKFASA